MQDASGDVRQAVVPSIKAIRQSFMVESQQVQDRRVQVVDTDPLLNGLVTELVAGSILHAAA